MQIIQGYGDTKKRSTLLEFRLYHMNRPSVIPWRKKSYKLDKADKLALELSTNILSLDSAAWYLEDHNATVQCLESNNISKLYYPKCFVEYDLFVHRPTYASDGLVLCKNPYFLKYCKIEEFVNFIELWCRGTMVLNFQPIYVQHNHLKFKLLDIVQIQTRLRITEVDKNIWVITR